MKWEYQTLQFRTVPTIGVWSRISDEDIQKLDSLLNTGWEVHETVNIRGSMGFSSYILFVLRKPSE